MRCTTQKKWGARAFRGYGPYFGYDFLVRAIAEIIMPSDPFV